jgi:hypothetical protein
MKSIHIVQYLTSQLANATILLVTPAGLPGRFDHSRNQAGFIVSDTSYTNPLTVNNLHDNILVVRPVDTSDSSVGRAVVISGEDSNVQ